MKHSPEDPSLDDPELVELVQRGYRAALALTNDAERTEDHAQAWDVCSRPLLTT